MRNLVGLAAACLLTSCLTPGDPYLNLLDEEPPKVELASMRPPPNPGGGIAQLSSTATVRVVFSEAMEPRSLVPGIGLLLEGEELPVQLAILPSATASASDRDLPYSVLLTLGGNQPFQVNSTYTLVLRTLLTDVQGNALTDEVRVPFLVIP